MKELKVVIAGIGTVGSGVLSILLKNNTEINKKLGKKLKIVAVASRRKIKDKLPKNTKIFKDAKNLLTFKEYDILIELIGGDEGIAKEIVFDALNKKKNVITANKALISKYGSRLAKLSEKNNCFLGFEASVAGGIPIIQIIKDFLLSNNISKIFGILNGTANFILTRMYETGKDFKEILKQAQKLGYAESDPKFDIDGTDTAHKLSILSTLAFGSEIDLKNIFKRGIEDIDLIDIKLFDSLGYKVKLLGITEKKNNQISQYVYPCLVKKDSILANVDDAFNGVLVESDFSKKLSFQGEGAGAYPTATSVLSDLTNYCRSNNRNIFNLKSNDLKKTSKLSINKRFGSYYLRFLTIDKPGVIADISKEFKKFHISMKSMLQEDKKSNMKKEAIIVVTTHDCFEEKMMSALKKIDLLDFVIKKTVFYRIEKV